MAKKKARRSNAELKQVEQKQAKQQKQIAHYEKSQRWMKWIALGILILILLALLAAGYATDWTRGLKKDASVGNLDSTGQADTTTSGADGATGASGRGGTNGGGGSTTTTTNNSSTTNNTTTNSGGGTDTNTLTEELIKLYNETGVGDNLDDLVTRAESLGIDVICTNDIIVLDCTFTANGQNFSVRALQGTGLITGILDGLNL